MQKEMNTYPRTKRKRRRRIEWIRNAVGTVIGHRVLDKFGDAIHTDLYLEGTVFPFTNLQQR